MTLAYPTGNATLCISVAARPGRFGITVHNAGYRAMGLDFFYRAFAAEEIAPVIAAVRALSIRGCSVSMPFKENVIAELDEVSPPAAALGAVNTVVNDRGRLRGFNTDVVGVSRCLAALPLRKGFSVTLLGAGGVARAVLHAVQERGAGSIVIYSRRTERTEALSQTFAVAVRPWAERGGASADLLVNATPLGMGDEDTCPVPFETLGGHAAVLDVVINMRATRLVETAAQRGLPCADGFTMAFHQACEQFALYTGREAPVDAMWEAARNLRMP